jgi:hypothetical protein
MRERLHLGAYGLALIALLGASRPAYAATPDTTPGLFTYVEPISHRTSAVSVLPDDSFLDCNQTCRASAKATKDWCIAHPYINVAAIAMAAGAAASAASDACTGIPHQGGAALCRAIAWGAANAAGALALMDLKRTCSGYGEIQYGSCMCGCMNNCGRS